MVAMAYVSPMSWAPPATVVAAVGALPPDAVVAQSVTSGLVQLAALSLLPVAIFGLAWNAGRIWRALRALWGRARRTAAEPSRPADHPPLERIAADARRLAADLDRLPPRAPWARRQGLILAYDDVLAVVARALEVEHSLTRLPLGWDRDLERIRVETALADAGLVLRPDPA